MLSRVCQGRGAKRTHLQFLNRIFRGKSLHKCALNSSRRIPASIRVVRKIQPPLDSVKVVHFVQSLRISRIYCLLSLKRNSPCDVFHSSSLCCLLGSGSYPRVVLYFPPSHASTALFGAVFAGVVGADASRSGSKRQLQDNSHS